jgi:L-arabinose isomerase
LPRRPTVALLGLSTAQRETDLAEHQEGYLAQLARRVVGVADIVSGVPAGSSAELAAALTEIENAEVDAIALIALGAQVPEGCTAALTGLDAPLLIGSVQPERAVGEDWSAYDLDFNAGGAGALSLASQCTGAGIGFAVLSGDWLSDRFIARFEDWARAARAARELAGELGRPDLLERTAQALFDEHAAGSLRATDWNRGAILVDPSPDPVPGPGPLTVAALARPHGDGLRLCVASGESLGAAELPQIEQPQLLFAPDAGPEAFTEAWLESGAPPQCVLAAGDRSGRWWRWAEMLEIEYEEI